MIRLLCLALIFATLPLRSANVTVFAAASLSDALEDIARNYKRITSGDTLRFNFAASSTLARQIREGAPADIFISADDAQMDTLSARNLLAPETRRTLLKNTLVVVVSARAKIAITQPQDLLAPAIRRLALGEPNTVPAGVYARAWLQRAGLWEKISASGKIIPCENVRAALATVESGNADAAIVYATDARISTKVRVAFAIPSEETPPITYSVAILKNPRNPDGAKKFAAYLETREATDVFQKYGFITK